MDKVLSCETTLALAMVRTQLKGPGDLEKVKATLPRFRVQGSGGLRFRV